MKNPNESLCAHDLIERPNPFNLHVDLKTHCKQSPTHLAIGFYLAFACPYKAAARPNFAALHDRMFSRQSDPC